MTFSTQSPSCGRSLRMAAWSGVRRNRLCVLLPARTHPVVAGVRAGLSVRLPSRRSRANVAVGVDDCCNLTVAVVGITGFIRDVIVSV